MDHQLIPALRKLLERQQAIRKDLERYEKGELPVPDAAVLERLRAIHARQRFAIEECLRQAANADATLVALLQEDDDTSAAARARAWADDLLTLYDSLADVLRGGNEFDQYKERAGAAAYAPPAPVEDPAPPEEEVAPVATVTGDLSRPVEEALRRLNDHSGLAGCELIAKIPRTLASIRAGWNTGDTAATPLSQAQALREALLCAIERLKPAGGSGNGGTEGLGYHILHEEYVLGKSTRYIMVRHSISESTFHRKRREAIGILAHELARQEEIVSRNGHSGYPGAPSAANGR
jgi:hypothetical protein